MDFDDWASDGSADNNLGDISALPEVEMPTPLPPPPPAPAPVAPVAPKRNAWAAPLPAATMARPGDVRASRQTPRAAPGFSRPASNTATLYVSNLPFETSEPAIADFFANCSVSPSDIRITRHSDTGNIKAAFVSVQNDHLAAALALNNRSLSGRPLHVKVDGDRGSAGGSGGYDRSGSGAAFDRGGSGNFDRGGGGNFDRGGVSGFDRGGSGSSGGAGFDRGDRGDRGFDRADRGDRGFDRSDRGGDRSFDRSDRAADRAHERGDRPARPGYGFHDNRAPHSAPAPHHAPAPLSAAPLSSVPQPPATARKRLNLKPRTKPPPVLEVDRRAIDGPKRRPPPPSSQGPQSRPTVQAPPPRKGGKSERWGPDKDSQPQRWGPDKDAPPQRRGTEKGATPQRWGPEKGTTLQRWGPDKETPLHRMGVDKNAPPSRQSQVQKPTSTNKEDDAKPPGLLNTFSALQVNEADV